MRERRSEVEELLCEEELVLPVWPNLVERMGQVLSRYQRGYLELKDENARLREELQRMRSYFRQ